MKLLVPATILCFALAAPAYAHQQEQQEQQQDKDKQKQDEKQKRDEKQKQQTEKQQPDKARQQDERAKQQDERAKQDNKQQRQDQDRQEQMRKENDQRSNGRVTEQRTQTRTISDAEFHQHFGREHHFRVGRADNNRFAYGGYNFEYTEAWPVGWGYDDDFYIDYIDGQYYLIDLSHPGPRLVLIIE